MYVFVYLYTTLSTPFVYRNGTESTRTGTHTYLFFGVKIYTHKAVATLNYQQKGVSVYERQ